MSWSASTPDSCPVPDALEDIDKLIIPAGEQDTPEGNSQLEAAKAAAKALILSGAVGATEGSEAVWFRTSLSGHANPDHKPSGTFVNDTITVSVSQVTPTKE